MQGHQIHQKIEMVYFYTLVFGLVVVAGFIRDALPVCVGVDSQVISSVTGAGPTAVDHVLHRQVGRRPHPSSLYVDAVLDKTITITIQMLKWENRFILSDCMLLTIAQLRMTGIH